MMELATDRLEGLRTGAAARFKELGYPTTRMEAWRYTNVAPISRTGFVPAARLAALPVDRLERFVLPELKGSQIVLVNGHYAPELSAQGLLPDGVLVGAIRDALGADPECVSTFLGRTADHREHAFTSLNLAEFQDGAFVYVPGGLNLEEPIHIVYLTVPQEAPAATHPRTLVVLQRGSSAKVVESYAGLEGTTYFTNAVTEIVLKDGCVLDHVRVQREARNAYHVGRTAVRQDRDSHLRSVYVSLGGLLARNEIEVQLAAPGAGCSLDGLYMATGRQHVDSQTSIDHAQPHCASQEMYKGILDGRASGVFNGKVVVRKDAQKTDAHQTNKNLLLSETAVIDTKPQLEIYADDVKCTHGATIGQLDQESVFYLRSRGISIVDARSLLVRAFANEILERIPVPQLRTQLEGEVLDWLGTGQGGAP